MGGIAAMRVEEHLCFTENIPGDPLHRHFFFDLPMCDGGPDRWMRGRYPASDARAMRLAFSATVVEDHTATDPALRGSRRAHAHRSATPVPAASRNIRLSRQTWTGAPSFSVSMRRTKFRVVELAYPLAVGKDRRQPRDCFRHA